MPQFREGQIAKGINRLYRRGGRIVRAWDPEIGTALIEITRKDTLDDGVTPDPEDVTVGEAWEELARTNPRIRRFLLKVIAGGAWGQLVMVHAPVLLAVLMKDAVRKHLPLAKLLAAFFQDDDDTGPVPDGPVIPGEVLDAAGSPGNVPGPLFGGMTPEDLQEMAAMADKLLAGATGKRRPGGTPRARPAASRAEGASPPAA